MPRQTQSTALVPQAQIPVPTPAQAKASQQAVARYEGRREGARIAVRQSGVGLSIDAPHADAAGHSMQILDAFGTRSTDFATHQMRWLFNPAAAGSAPDEVQVNSALALVDSVRPQNELEAALAVQIAATHEASLTFLRRAQTATLPVQLDINLNAATKLQRTLVAQIEALSKLRRGGEQNVTVKHVHVHEGGQAVIGNVSADRGGPQAQIEGESHATGRRALPSPERAEVRGEDAVRRLLPVAGGER